jgi:regulator of sirC expression with transglutaminase-like and TPR domain
LLFLFGSAGAFCHIKRVSPTPDLPFLIQLLDDDNAVVRQAVRKRLEDLRQEIPAQLAELDLRLSETQERLLGEFLAPSCREELMQAWPGWRAEVNENRQLESALSQISALLGGWQTRVADVSHRLDSLARQVEESAGGEVLDARFLAEWLFGGRGQEQRFRGNSRDYYSPDNSNLLWVMQQGLGNPLSLAVLYRLVGGRLGIEVYGCNFPGHFLARVEMDGQTWLVDCFNRGKFMLAADVARLHPAANPAMEEMVRTIAPVDSIVLRLLRNLDDAFDRLSKGPERQLMRKLAVKLMDVDR